MKQVAPFTGAWIEMAEIMAALKGDKSRPSRARGLKSYGFVFTGKAMFVAPFKGAWIEIVRDKSL